MLPGVTGVRVTSGPVQADPCNFHAESVHQLDPASLQCCLSDGSATLRETIANPTVLELVQQRDK